MALLALKQAAPHRGCMAENEDLDERKFLGLALRTLRTRAGLSQQQAGEGFRSVDDADDQGISGQAWSAYERGAAAGIERSSVQRRLAAAVHTSYDQLLAERDRLRAGGNPARPPALAVADLPIRRRVQAGAWLAVEDVDQTAGRRYPAAPDPRFPHAEQWLSEVVGDSMNALPEGPILEGDLVHVVDIVGIGYHPRTGDVVEVERLRFQGGEREVSIKQVEVLGRDVLLWPRSTNTRWAAPLALRSDVAEHEEIEVRIAGLVLSSIRRFHSI